MRRRGEFEIIADILKEALEGAPKTRIMNRANLGRNSFLNYLSGLLDKELIEVVKEESGFDIYRTTQKGKVFLESFEKAKKTYLG